VIAAGTSALGHKQTLANSFNQLIGER